MKETNCTTLFSLIIRGDGSNSCCHDIMMMFGRVGVLCHELYLWQNYTLFLNTFLSVNLGDHRKYVVLASFTMLQSRSVGRKTKFSSGFPKSSISKVWSRYILENKYFRSFESVNIVLTSNFELFGHTSNQSIWSVHLITINVKTP